MPTKEELLEGFTIGEWEILPGQGVFRRGDKEVRPEPLIFKVLYSLAMRDGECVTRDDLVADAWDGRPTADDPINRSIAQLRAHLGDKARPHQYVETLHRRGYRLVQPVQLHRKDDDGDAVAEPSLNRWRLLALGLAVGLLATIVISNLPLQQPPIGVRSIAILPIDNLSGDPANQYIVDGVKNVLARRLSEVPDLAIKNTRVRYDEEPSEIAQILEVDGVLSCSLQLQGETLKVTYLISRGADNVTIGSGEVDGNLDGIFSLQERLARSVRDDLDGEATPELITEYVPDSDAYDSYMRGMYKMDHRAEAADLDTAIELFQQSINLDEYYGPAYLALATAYVLMPYYSDSPVAETGRLAIETAEAGIRVDSNIQDATGAVYGRVYHNEKRWRESEDAYRRAVSASVVDSNAFNWYSRMLASVGRLDDSLAQSLAAVAIDPDNAIINSRVAIAYTWLGESQAAYEYFERANSLGASGITTHLLPYTLMLVQDGRYEEAKDVAIAASVAAGVRTSWVDPVFNGFRDPSLRSDALLEVDRAVADGTLGAAAEITSRVLLGDVEGAMDIAERLPEPGEVFEMDLLYSPEFRELRKHPGFMPLLERLGVVRYWEQADCSFDGSKAVCASG